jgi:hypothetical protein
MSRGVGRAAAAGLLGALAAIMWMAVFYGFRPSLVLRFDAAPPPALLSGIYPVERDPVAGTTFAWTRERLTLDLPGIDRRVEWQLTLRVRGARVAPQPNPDLTFFVDGVAVATRPTTTDYGDVTVVLPARPERSGMTIGVRTSSTFVPGPSDPRPLGVMLDELRLTPSGIVAPPSRAFAGAAAAAAAIGAAIATLGVTAGSAIGGTAIVAAGIAATIARGFGPYSGFPSTAAWLGIAVAVALAVGAAIVRRVRRAKLRNTARFAAAWCACALLLKLLVLLHPDMPVGDALFHAHRFQEVLAGHLFFTSVAPGNYLFPYAPGLYVFAWPFAALVERGAGDMALLRIVSAAADAAVAVLLYPALVRANGDRLAAACAVAVYELIPLAFGVLTVGNLTNAFAQSVSVLALVMMAGAPLRLERRKRIVLFAAVLTAAFLSHTSTFAILSVACVLTAAVFFWRGGRTLRSPSRAVLLATAVAVFLAVALYYARFMDTYNTQLARIGAETAAAAPDAGGRGILARLISVPRYLDLYFGIPVLILAGWGAGVMWRTARTDRLTLALAGWALACVAFLVLGVLTPVDMRYYLAAIPVMAIAAGTGASAAWRHNGRSRAAAAILLAWVLINGVHGWWTALG